MTLGRKIKQLRKEKGWAQDDLAERIDSDARQISRYENARISPSIDTLVRIAEVFDVSIDYLLIEDAARRPLHIEGDEFLEKLQGIRTLPDSDIQSLLNVVDGLIAKNRVQSLAQELR